MITDKPAKDTDFQARRRFLTTSALTALATATSVVSGSAQAKQVRSATVPLIEKSEPSPLQGKVAEIEKMANRRLHLVNEHTGDNVDVVYYTHGIFINDNVAKLNHLMRDRRANIATQMDTTLYDQLFLLRAELGTEDPIHILSGYRTPETNAKLRRRSKGVAKFSLHMEGRAADIYIPGVSAKAIHTAATRLQAGGVGLYSQSNFVHIDTGQVRYWGS